MLIKNMMQLLKNKACGNYSHQDNFDDNFLIKDKYGNKKFL